VLSEQLGIAGVEVDVAVFVLFRVDREFDIDVPTARGVPVALCEASSATVTASDHSLPWASNSAVNWSWASVSRVACRASASRSACLARSRASLTSWSRSALVMAMPELSLMRRTRLLARRRESQARCR
jgi:hypothetical protein